MSDAVSPLDEGIQLFREGKFEEASTRLQDVILADPSNIQARSYLGAAYARAGKPDLAVKHFKAVTELDPNNATCFFNLGQGYEAVKDAAGAIGAYQRAMLIDPSHQKARARLAALQQTAQRPAPQVTMSVPPAMPVTGPPAMPPPVGQPPAPYGQPQAPVPGSPPQGAAQPYQQAPSPYGQPPSPYGQPAGTYPPPGPPKVSHVLEHTANSAAHWLYLIAGLSIVNIVLTMFLDVDLVFAVGLGFTNIVSQIVMDKEMVSDQARGTAIGIALVINLIVIGFYALLGYCASKKMKWAFIVALILYAIDTLLVLLDLRIISIIFHVLALIAIVKGLQAACEISKIERQAHMQQPMQPPYGPTPYR